MREIRRKISDLYEIEPQTRDQPKELAAITAYVLKHYAFLPKPIAVIVEGDEVVISYPEEPDTKREEAARLADRAVRANFVKVITTEEASNYATPSRNFAKQTARKLRCPRKSQTLYGKSRKLSTVPIEFLESRIQTSSGQFRRQYLRNLELGVSAVPLAHGQFLHVLPTAHPPSLWLCHAQMWRVLVCPLSTPGDAR